PVEFGADPVLELSARTLAALALRDPERQRVEHVVRNAREERAEAQAVHRAVAAELHRHPARSAEHDLDPASYPTGEQRREAQVGVPQLPGDVGGLAERQQRRAGRLLYHRPDDGTR